MPFTRPRCRLSPRSREGLKWKHIQARAYLVSQATPKRISIDTKVDNIPARYALVEPAFGDDSNFQSYIHDFRVQLDHGRNRDLFQIFMKRHVRLQPNGNVADVFGDLIVMRVSSQDETAVVNARAGDERMMDFVIAQCALQFLGLLVC
uniref:Uncharacterized protein n=1 Tax=Mycena chlorophos TaxID=658473 RepID=A0ABQ0LH15_MYCCL|nr:predicted protein [Mycena chlorophos]